MDKNKLLSVAKGLVEEEVKMNKIINVSFSERGLIRCFDGEDNYVSNAIVWFDCDGEPIIAEPYVIQHADGEVREHFYNRETEFEVLNICGDFEEEEEKMDRIDVSFSGRGFIRCYDGEDSYVSNAIVWFDCDGEPVIAEPYVIKHADGEMYKHFYNREKEFDVLAIFGDDFEEEDACL